MRQWVWVAVAVALAGCSAHTDPALTDDQLAHEYVQATSGKQLETAADPARTRQLAIEMASINCDLMRRGEDSELLSRTPGDARNADLVRALEEKYRQEAGNSAESTVSALVVSAKYRCSEYTPMLASFRAVYGS